MGRVKRYKQVKAHDPFSRKKMGATCRRKGKAKDFDLPPEDEELDAMGDTVGLIERTGKRERRIERSWEREVLGYQENETDKVLIAPRGEDETQKQFKGRLRREGAKFMKEAVEAGSTTKAKRKEKLKLRTKKRKLQKKAKAEDDLLPLPSQRISVTDRVDAPPLLSVRPRLPKRNMADIAPKEDRTQEIEQQSKKKPKKVYAPPSSSVDWERNF